MGKRELEDASEWNVEGCWFGGTIRRTLWFAGENLSVGGSEVSSRCPGSERSCSITRRDGSASDQDSPEAGPDGNIPERCGRSAAPDRAQMSGQTFSLQKRS